jgi:hypothetical protein
MDSYSRMERTHIRATEGDERVHQGGKPPHLESARFHGRGSLGEKGNTREAGRETIQPAAARAG